MKVAVLGPVTKDFVEIDGNLSYQIGGIPYYVAEALKALEVEKIVPYVTCGLEDNQWVKNSFTGLEVKCIKAEKTLESHIKYSSNKPDERKHYINSYSNTIKPKEKLLKELEDFDYVILGPLFHDNIPYELFKKLKHKNLVLGNFGMFTYGEDGKFVRKNPEKMIEILPFIKYLFLDKNEAEFVSGKIAINDIAQFFQNKGLDNIIITEGSKGSHLFISKNYYKISSFKPHKIIDTTGAGDTYLAAFIRAQELFNNPEEQGKFAAMVATMSLEEKGAFNKNLKEVLIRLKS